MDKKKEQKYLKKWGFKNRSALEKDITNSIMVLEFEATKIFQFFKEKVGIWAKDLLADNKERFVAETESPPNEKLVKSSQRIAEKILESWEEYEKWTDTPKGQRGEEPERHHPKEFLNTMNDVVRFRIICNYLNDVEYIGKKLKGSVAKTKQFKLIKWKDYIETPYPEHRAGHRALQFVFQYIRNKNPILFEVQIMTQLQHAWDKKDHHLIYEYVRIERGQEIPLHLKNRMAAMSEVLYVADNVFDDLKNEITSIMGEK